MDVMDFFVTTGLDVYHTHLYVMDIHHAVMDLMKQIVVRYIKLCAFAKVVPYSGNVWRGESLANLANEHNFAKLKPSKRHMQVTKQWDCTPICQTFFAKSFIRSISPNIIAAKHFCYTVLNQSVCSCLHHYVYVTGFAKRGHIHAYINNI